MFLRRLDAVVNKRKSSKNLPTAGATSRPGDAALVQMNGPCHDNKTPLSVDLDRCMRY